MPDYQDVNQPTGNVSPAGVSNNNATQGWQNGPTTGSDSWDNSGDASFADGFGGEADTDDYGNRLSSRFGDEFEDDDPQTGDSDEDNDNPNELEDDPTDPNGPAGGAQAEGNDNDARLSNTEWREKRLNEVASQRDEYREPARQYGIQSGAHLSQALDFANDGVEFCREFGVSNFRELRAILTADAEEKKYSGRIAEFEERGAIDPEVAEFLRSELLPQVRELASAKPLYESIQKTQAEQQFSNWVADTKRQFPHMDEDAVRDAYRAGFDGNYIAQVAQRTHTRTESLLRANRQQDVVRGNVPKPNVPRVESARGGESAAISRIPDPIKDPEGFRRYRQEATRNLR